MLNSVLKHPIDGFESTAIELGRKRATSRALCLEKQLELGLVHRLPYGLGVNVERHMSISSYLIVQRRVARRHERAALEEPLRSRWYVPLLAAALALLALIVAAVAALEIVTAGHQRPPHVTQPARAEPGSRLEPGSYVEPGPDLEMISAER